MPIATRLLILLIFCLASVGSLPTTVRTGPTTLGGLLTVAVLMIAVLATLLDKYITARSTKHIFILLPILAMSAAGTTGLYYPATKDSALLSLIFFSSILIIARMAHAARNPCFYRELEKIILIFSIIYIIIAIPFSFIYKHGPAFALSGMIFFAFHYVRYRKGSTLSLIYLAICLLAHLTLSARIAVLSEIIILIFGRYLIPLQTNSHKSITTNILKNSTFLISGSSLFLFAIFILSEKFIGGDAGLNIAGHEINTNGRIEMWQLLIRSSADSLWLGHGMAGPQEMLLTPGWAHPHNDYLRLLHQFGAFGLFLWITFLLVCLRDSRKKIVEDIQRNNKGIISRTAFLSLLMFIISMLTDNSIIYSYVIFPVIALSGASIPEHFKNTKPKKVIL